MVNSTGVQVNVARVRTEHKFSGPTDDLYLITAWVTATN